MKPLCVLLTALLLAASAQAKLGESEEEITARWGQPANRTGPPSESYGCIYHVPGFQVLVTFEHGLSTREVYSAEVKIAKRYESRPMRKEEAEPLIFAHGGRAVWNYASEKKTDKAMFYRRQDGALGAVMLDASGVEVYLATASASSEVLKNKQADDSGSPASKTTDPIAESLKRF